MSDLLTFEDRVRSLEAKLEANTRASEALTRAVLVLVKQLAQIKLSMSAPGGGLGDVAAGFARGLFTPHKRR